MSDVPRFNADDAAELEIVSPPAGLAAPAGGASSAAAAAAADSAPALLVLDSSFNPPTRAHHGLIAETLRAFAGVRRFTHVLLLYAIRNVDKHKVEGASAAQRVVLMEALAADLAGAAGAAGIAECAVGVVKCGRFFDKATALHAYLAARHGIRHAELYFIMGYDTIIRLFDAKYYEPRDMAAQFAAFFQTARVVCADRVTDDSGRARTFGDALAGNALFEAYKDRILPLGGWAQSAEGCNAAISSTRARKLLAEFWQSSAAAEDKQDLLREISALVTSHVMDRILDMRLYEA